MKYQDEAKNVVAKSKLMKAQCSNCLNFVHVSFMVVRLSTIYFRNTTLKAETW